MFVKIQALLCSMLFSTVTSCLGVVLLVGSLTVAFIEDAGVGAVCCLLSVALILPWLVTLRSRKADRRFNSVIRQLEHDEVFYAAIAFTQLNYAASADVEEPRHTSVAVIEVEQHEEAQEPTELVSISPAKIAIGILAFIVGYPTACWLLGILINLLPASF